MFEHASDLRGFLVVATEEGAQAGVLSSVQVDVKGKCMAGLVYRTRRVAGERRFVAVDQIQSLGRDVALISSETSTRLVTAENPAPGRSLRELQGAWVATMEGEHLGTLLDLDFSRSDWSIKELILADHKRLPVEAREIKIADEVLVPASYAQRVEPEGEEKPGLLERALGSDTVDHIRGALQRSAARVRGNEKVKPDKK